jgi:hypothetical protein
VDEINCLHGKTGFVKPIDLMSLKTTFAEGNEISILRCLNKPDNVSMVSLKINLKKY